MENSTHIEIEALTSKVGEWTSAVNSFSANVPLTTNTCADAFAALAAAGFCTTACTSYDSNVDSLSQVLASACAGLNQYVEAAVAADENIEDNIPEEVEETEEEPEEEAEENDEAVSSGEELAEENVEEEVSDESLSGLDEEAEEVAPKDEQEKTELDDEHKEEEKDLKDPNKEEEDEKPKEEEKSKIKSKPRLETPIGDNPPSGDTSDLVDKFDEYFKNIKKTKLSSLLEKLYRIAMEKNISLEELLTNEKYSSLLISLFSENEDFTKLYNSDSSKFVKLLYGKILGNKNLYGISNSNMEALKTYLNDFATNKGITFEDLINNKDYAIDIKNYLAEFENGPLFVNSFAQFGTDELLYALKSLLG